MNPYSLNFLFSAIVLVFFLIQGILRFKEIKSSKTYFLIDRNLGGEEYGNTFAAASTSLATVLYFFVTLGVQDGLYILWSPFTYALGGLFFVKYLLPKIEQLDYFKESTEQTDFSSTLGKFLFFRYKSSLIEYSVLLVTFLGMMSILLIELFVGVTIFSIYLKPEYVDYALILIAFIVFCYSSLGGFPAVVRTDKLQLKLIIVSTILLLLFLIIYIYDFDLSVPSGSFFPRSLIFDNGIILSYPLLLNIFFVNLLLIPSLLRTWQMNASVSKSKEVSVGIRKGIILTTLLTTIFILIGILFYKVAFVDSEISLNGLLIALASIDSFGTSYIIFPLFFAACLAALLSTADSAILPITQTIYSDFLKKNQSEWKTTRVTIINLVILIVGLSLYFVVFRLLKFDIINWLFTIFSFLIVIAPVIIYAVAGNSKFLQSRFGKISAFIAIWIGLGIAISLSLIGNHYEMLWIIQLNTPIAAVFGFIVISIANLLYNLLEGKK